MCPSRGAESPRHGWEAARDAEIIEGRIRLRHPPQLLAHADLVPLSQVREFFSIGTSGSNIGSHGSGSKGQDDVGVAVKGHEVHRISPGVPGLRPTTAMVLYCERLKLRFSQ